MKKKPSKAPRARTRAAGTARSRKRRAPDAAPAPVTAVELQALRKELEARLRHPASRTTPMRWNPDPEDVQKSVAQLVLTIVEFLRQLMERQAIRRMEQKTLTKAQVEAVGAALMTLEQTVRDIGSRFGLSPDDLNLDLGPLGKLM